MVKLQSAVNKRVTLQMMNKGSFIDFNFKLYKLNFLWQVFHNFCNWRFTFPDVLLFTGVPVRFFTQLGDGTHVYPKSEPCCNNCLSLQKKSDYSNTKSAIMKQMSWWRIHIFSKILFLTFWREICRRRLVSHIHKHSHVK